MYDVIGLIEHDPRQGTMFGGCTVRKLGLAAFEVTLEPGDIIIATVIWRPLLHTIMVVPIDDTHRHIVTYGHSSKPHVSPACPFVAKLLRRQT